MNRAGRPAAAALLLATALAAAGPTEPAPDPAQTQQVLHALLAAADAPLRAGSGCEGDFGQPGTARLRHLLAMRLAYLHQGDNRISGHCAQQRCVLSITHAAGEDRAATEIRFALRRGQAVPASLACTLTP